MSSKDMTKGKVLMPMGGVDKSTPGTPKGIKQQTFRGSQSNLDHSINGASAHQGRSKGGKANGFD